MVLRFAQRFLVLADTFLCAVVLAAVVGSTAFRAACAADCQCWNSSVVSTPFNFAMSTSRLPEAYGAVCSDYSVLPAVVLLCFHHCLCVLGQWCLHYCFAAGCELCSLHIFFLDGYF